MKIARSTPVTLFQETGIRSNFKTEQEAASSTLLRRLTQMPVPPLAWPGRAPLAAAGGCTERSQNTASRSRPVRATSGTTERPAHTQPPCHTQGPPDRAPARQTRRDLLLTWPCCRPQDTRTCGCVRGPDPSSLMMRRRQEERAKQQHAHSGSGNAPSPRDDGPRAGRREGGRTRGGHAPRTAKAGRTRGVSLRGLGHTEHSPSTDRAK